MLVMKFGGTSVGSSEALERIVEILKEPLKREQTALVVVSAFSGVSCSLSELSAMSASGDPSYAQAAESLKKRHLDVLSHFLGGNDFERESEKFIQCFSEFLRVLDGVSVLRELSPRITDMVNSFGELFSALVVSSVFNARGLPASFCDSRTLVKTNSDFGRAAVLEYESYSLIRSWFLSLEAGGKGNPLPVIPGSIGQAPDGSTTAVGKGAADLTAAILGAALGAEEIVIWTDVDGILTADPRQVKNAFSIDSISYEEAMELSHFGAKVIYPPAIQPAMEKGIPIHIKNTFNPLSPGTCIQKEGESGPYPVRGISSMSPVSLIRVQGPAMVGVAGFSSRLFGALARRKISVVLITQSSSEFSICFGVLPQDVSGAEEVIKEEFDREIARGAIDPPATEHNLSIVAVVGAKMKRAAGISGKVFHALGRNGINVIAIAQGSSEINISSVISRQDEAKALNAIHEAFFLAGYRSVNLFLIGTGLIGGTLLEQISRQREILAENHKIRINLAGAADSKHMLFDSSGLDPGKIKSELKTGEGGEAREPFSLKNFIERMKTLNLPNTAFCDCTASDDVANSYDSILKAAIPVITPNKRANGGSLEYFKTLKDFSRDRGIPYLYETTVCAGLPVISTLRDLAMSGDRIRRIEAVLSGTLSFIFNNFDGTKTFSALVREAKAKGYTEPDPRDDLNAMDAARKALILARECGIPLEFSSVVIEPLLPPACFEASGVEEFFKELEKTDAGFEERRSRAESEGRALRYIAVIEESSARISLREEAAGSPFRSLLDADNIVVITTERYSALPMVIKGPGAGAQVTAGGVFADIARIARTLV